MRLSQRIISICLVLGFAASWPVAGSAAEPSTDPAALRAEIAKIRRNTDWGNADAVKAAEARIQQLLRQLEQGRQKATADAASARGESAPAAAEAPAIDRATVLQDVQTAAAQGRKTDLELAEPVRKRIQDEYEEERNPTPDNAGFLQELPVLVIDFSMPGAAALVELLPRYQGVRTLVLTGGARGAAVDLPGVLAKARHLPLQTLAIVHFRQHVTAVPPAIGGFKALTALSLVDNAIASWPRALDGLPRLAVLHLDANPLVTALPGVTRLPALKELGLAQTRLRAAELADIAAALPGCKVLTQ